MDKVYESGLIIDSEKFNKVVKKLREFFWSKNFIEVHTQNRLSILAACEDPFNVQTFEYMVKYGHCSDWTNVAEYEIFLNRCSRIFA